MAPEGSRNFREGGKSRMMDHSGGFVLGRFPDVRWEASRAATEEGDTTEFEGEELP